MLIVHNLIFYFWSVWVAQTSVIALVSMILYHVSEQKKNQVVKHRDKILKGGGFVSRLPIFPLSSNLPLFPHWPSNTAEAIKITSFFKLRHQLQRFHFTAVLHQLCLSAWSKNADWVRVIKMILVEWEYYIITIIPISQFLLRHSFINWLWCIDLWFGPIMTDDKIKLIMDFWFRLGAHWGQAVYLTWQEIYVFIWVVCVCVCVCVWEGVPFLVFEWVGEWVCEEGHTLWDIRKAIFLQVHSYLLERERPHREERDCGIWCWWLSVVHLLYVYSCWPVCVCVSVSEKYRASIL